MSKYNFYYDESEHSRKISHKTITADNYFDSFIAVVVGWRSENQVSLYEKYAAFEKKYQHRQSNSELKSTTIKQNQLKSGFASLNNDTLSLLEDFLVLFNEETLIYYSVTSKIEYIIRQLFEDYKNSLFVDMDAMKYSITRRIFRRYFITNDTHQKEVTLMAYTEANYENAVIEVFRDTLGYGYTYAPDLARDYSDVLYTDELLPALQRVNPKLPEAALTEAVYKLRNFEGGTMLTKNMQFMDYLQNGVSVNFYDKGEQWAALVYLVDYENIDRNVLE